MAAKKNPFAAFEKSAKDKTAKAAAKKGGVKAGAFPGTQALKCGGMVGKKK